MWVAGEISNYSRPQSGHCYFTLKDDQAQIRAVMWRTTASKLKFDLADGLEVICHGHLDVYAPRGSYQLVVDQCSPRASARWSSRCGSCARSWPPKGCSIRPQAAAAGVSAADGVCHQPDRRGRARFSAKCCGGGGGASTC